MPQDHVPMFYYGSISFISGAMNIFTFSVNMLCHKTMYPCFTINGSIFSFQGPWISSPLVWICYATRPWNYVLIWQYFVISGAMNFFTSSVNTLCHMTMELCFDMAIFCNFRGHEFFHLVWIRYATRPCTPVLLSMVVFLSFQGP